MLAGLLNDFKDALMTGCAGSSRPPNLQAGGLWIDTTNQSPPTNYWSFRFYTGSVDIEVFRLSVINGFGGTLFGDSEFDVSHVAADTAGAIFELIKQRVVDNGQVLSGDTVAELRFIGTTNTATQPITAYLRWTAGEDEATDNGGTFSIASTAAATTALTEHFRLISGVIETVKPHKLNSLRLVSQNVATTATIAALDATCMVVEMTGSTATAIEGIDATGKTQVITIHNRSSAIVTLKHQNTSATATNRLKLPPIADVPISPNYSATLYYCTTDQRWKMKDGTVSRLSNTIDLVAGIGRTWTAPSTVSRVNITAYPRYFGLVSTMNESAPGSGFIDCYGNMYAWGDNATVFGKASLGDGTIVSRSSPVAVIGGIQFSQTAPYINQQGKAYLWGANNFGELGTGDVVPRSSPVAVLGGLVFSTIIREQSGNVTFGLTKNGSLYAWGLNTSGIGGIGDSNARSSPVAVLGGHSFQRIFYSTSTAYGITSDGTTYSWGSNLNGQLGLGDVTARSSPTLVLGGLKFSDVNGVFCTVGLTTSGAAYAWGYNADGGLGLGDTVDRSSPVAVLGGLTFAKLSDERYPNAASLQQFALTSDGTLYAWGANSNGELGVGDVIPRSSPVAVLGGLKFRKVIAGIGGLTLDGILYTWGNNSNAILGLGDIISRSSPVAVLGGHVWADVTVGAGSYMLGVTVDGTVYSWGFNNRGQLGVGGVATQSSPVAVLGPFQGMGSVPQPKRFTVSVTPGQSYKVQCSQSGQSYFGSTPMGEDVDYVTIEYLK